MYQETNSTNATKRDDILLTAGLIVLLLFARGAMNALKSLPFGGIAQIVVFLLMVALCFYVYKKRLCAYRFTLFNEEPAADELDEFGNPAKNPYPLGTFIAERMNGSKGRVMDAIAPGEMVELLPPGSELPDIPKARDSMLSVGKKATAWALVYRRNGLLYALRFHPTDKLAGMLGEIVAAVKAEQA